MPSSQPASERSKNRGFREGAEYVGAEGGTASWEYDLDSEYPLYHFGDESFSPKQFGELDPYEEEYLQRLKSQAMGHTETLAQRQIRESTRRTAGAMQGIASSRQARNAAGALRGGRQGAEMVYAQGQEALGLQKAADMQAGEDAFRQAALGKISGAGMQAAQRTAQQRAQETALAGAGIGAVGAIIGGLLAWSDERLKSKVSPKKGENELRDMLNKMKPVNYDMFGKNESGIVAQDLEKSDAGREMVRKGPAGLRMVDTGQAAKKMLAAMALINQDNVKMQARLDKLEGKKGGR